MFDDRTIYTIEDETGKRTTITLPKVDADVLQVSQPNVHAWLQGKFDNVTKKYPHLGRRERGNLVRLLAVREAENHPSYKDFLDDCLGL